MTNCHILAQLLADRVARDVYDRNRDGSWASKLWFSSITAAS